MAVWKIMNEPYQAALKTGHTHCVSFVIQKDNPQLPWRQSFFKSAKEAKAFEKTIKGMGGRAMSSGMYSPRNY